MLVRRSMQEFYSANHRPKETVVLWIVWYTTMQYTYIYIFFRI